MSLAVKSLLDIAQSIAKKRIGKGSYESFLELKKRVENTQNQQKLQNTQHTQEQIPEDQGRNPQEESMLPLNSYNSSGTNNYSEPKSQIGPASFVPLPMGDFKNYFQTKEEIPQTKNIKLSQLPDSIVRSLSTNWEPINYRNVKDWYYLYRDSYVNIYFDENKQKLIYDVDEPILTEREQEILNLLKRAFVHVFSKVSPSELETSQEDMITKGCEKLSSRYGYSTSEESRRKISYYIIRDFLGLEILEPLMHDPYIEDVSCDGVGIPLFINHLKYGSLEVTRKFTEVEKLNSFIVKLAQRSLQEVSLSNPILQGSLQDGSRVEAIYGKDISVKGSSFTIRKFRADPFTPIHLLDTGTLPSFLLAYLWLAVENKKSILVSGGTATGKTTILNALSLFVPPTSKVVSIEDTPEINLPHEHWLPMVSREREGKSDVTMFDLLKASLRERPEYIIVGEIRGKEAYVLFQGMATGHAGLGTVHGDKFEDLVNRMIIDPINLPKPLLTEMDIIIFMKQIKVKNTMVRRVSSVVEILSYDQETDSIGTNQFVTYKPHDDSFEFAEESAVVSELLDLRGGEEDALWQEIEKRRRILDLIREKKILEFKNVGDLISSYYKDSKGIFEAIEVYEKNKK